jgi:hypothetical protein
MKVGPWEQVVLLPFVGGKGDVSVAHKWLTDQINTSHHLVRVDVQVFGIELAEGELSDQVQAIKVVKYIKTDKRSACPIVDGYRMLVGQLTWKQSQISIFMEVSMYS